MCGERIAHIDPNGFWEWAIRQTPGGWVAAGRRALEGVAGITRLHAMIGQCLCDAEDLNTAAGRPVSLLMTDRSVTIA
ncbi:hypothetical protein GCM10010112_42340 [Actinoplanes lobatus]|uniref:Uncharacterized protein n=1 Tax=Actinoplanes lobatus TaxID=113568 RepID=A0ABQ4AFC9_9ACTN|nr:hypothetical protein GCM10010112_42340 [Actinoplanes lobatus]GIE39713.1 hypothetical protein Alo02nite_26110 [Actinoplanes lobatus]